jgi:hypothetical protein
MTIATENFQSRAFTLGRNATREYRIDVQGTEDDSAVEALLLATVPASYAGLEIESISAETEGGGLWRCTAKYQRFVNADEYTFDTGGGTTKITQSINTINRYPRPGFTAPDYLGAIGVTDDGVEGVDIHSPQFEFSETHKLSDTFVLAGYKTLVFGLTGTVNNASFKGLAAGECLFLGASGSKRGDEMWQVTYRFAGSQNATGLTIGDITGIAKKGWEYLWVSYDDYKDPGSISFVKRPKCVSIEQVYRYTDFSTLGIGT